MFRRISHRIARQFTLFVFLLLLVNGMVFLAVDFSNALREAHHRLERSMQIIIDQADRLPRGVNIDVPPFMRDRVRVVSAGGVDVYRGAFFEGLSFTPQEGYSQVFMDGEPYHILTAAVLRGEELLGYAQIADVERIPLKGLPPRALLYLAASVLISIFTYIVGLSFARRSLHPAVAAMERLEQFTQDASHELRTPIAALSSSLDLALKTHKYREGIVSAKEDLQDVSHLVERLLELARLEKITLSSQKIDLSGLVEDSVERHRALAAEKGIALHAQVAPGITAHGDSGLVRQILGNLIGNALKFNKPKGSVTVRLSRGSLSVEDTGIGIAPEALAHIFDRFYQAESSRSHDGYGLGLALVKRIVDVHGWTIRVVSEEGKGSEFILKF